MNSFTRDWIGTFDQPNFGEYPVRLTIDDDQIEVRYPTLGCGGFLRLEKIEDGVAYLRENIIYGTSNCLNGVQVQLSKRGGHLRFVVLLPDGTPGGEGSLSPV
ncbi:MAG TPA: hypothetical protein VJB57_15700 [Dehalococcoidia bacterium]|nr:hypothetical protein [Dehalococcoidia bacterium]